MKMNFFFNKLFGIILILSFLLGCSEKKDNQYLSTKGEVMIDFKGKKSKYHWVFKRVFTDYLVRIKTASFSEYKLSSISFSGGLLSGLNFKESKLYIIDSNLTVKNTFGKKGLTSVDRNSGIMSYDFFGDTIMLYDFGSKNIKKFITKISKPVEVNYLGNKLPIYRVGFISTNTILYAEPNEKPMDFKFIFLNNETKKSFSLDSIFEHKIRMQYPSMAYDGQFTSNNNSNYIVFSCSFTGIFFCFSKKDMSFKYYARTVDATPTPIASYVEIAPGVKSLEISPSIFYFESTVIDGNYLFNMNLINKNHYPTVDMYDLSNNGTYMGSFYIPFYNDKYPPKSISVKEKSIFILYDNISTIAQYEIRKF